MLLDRVAVLLQASVLLLRLRYTCGRPLSSFGCSPRSRKVLSSISSEKMASQEDNDYVFVENDLSMSLLESSSDVPPSPESDTTRPPSAQVAAGIPSNPPAEQDDDDDSVFQLTANMSLVDTNSDVPPSPELGASATQDRAASGN